jgi:hypothetical protein
LMPLDPQSRSVQPSIAAMPDVAAMPMIDAGRQRIAR